MFAETELELLQKIVQQGLLGAFGETLLMTFVPTILAFAIGLPLGVILVTGEEGGIHPLPRWLMTALNFIINILRSVPFLILMILVVWIGSMIGYDKVIQLLKQIGTVDIEKKAAGEDNPEDKKGGGDNGNSSAAE